MTEELGIAIGMIGIIVGAIGAYAAVRAYHLAYRHLRASGGLESPELQMRCFGTEEPCTDFYIGIALQPGKFAEIEMPVDIRNNGGKTADDIEVYIRMNKALIYGGNINIVPVRDKPNGWVQLSTSGNFASLTIGIKSLHPDDSGRILIPLLFTSDSRVQSSIRARTKDGHDVIASWKAIVAYAVQIVVTCRDQQPLANKLSLTIINTEKETIASLLNDQSDSLENEFKKLSLYKRIRSAFSSLLSSQSRRIAVVCTNLPSRTHKGVPVDVYEGKDMYVYSGIATPRAIWVPALGVAGVRSAPVKNKEEQTEETILPGDRGTPSVKPPNDEDDHSPVRQDNSSPPRTKSRPKTTRADAHRRKRHR